MFVNVPSQSQCVKALIGLILPHLKMMSKHYKHIPIMYATSPAYCTDCVCRDCAYFVMQNLLPVSDSYSLCQSNAFFLVYADAYSVGDVCTLFGLQMFVQCMGSRCLYHLLSIWCCKLGKPWSTCFDISKLGLLYNVVKFYFIISKINWPLLPIVKEIL